MTARPAARRLRRWLTAAAVVSAAAALLTGCGTGSPAQPTDGHTALNVVLAWYPDPESGGFYTAEQQGYYKNNNLDVTITPGGPQVSASQIVAGGRAQIGISDATSIALAREQGIPLVAIAAMYQTNPVGVMVHADSGINSFQDMAGHTWAVQTGQYGPDFIKKNLGINFKTQAYQGSIANFVADDSLVQQGWPTNEVYQAQEKGVKTKFFNYAQAGFNPYNDVVFTTEDYLAKHGDAVRSFLEAAMHGWSDYVSDANVAATTNTDLRKVNTEQSEQSVWFAWDKQRQYIVDGDGQKQLGAMTGERWQTLVKQLRDLGVLTKDLDPAQLYNASLLPTVGAPANLPGAPANSY
jgi:NitT/TauT family transport system substrate-binding protein